MEGFPPKIICFKTRGRVGGSRRTSLKKLQKREPSASFGVVETTLCMCSECRDRPNDNSLRVLALSKRKNDDPLHVLGVS